MNLFARQMMELPFVHLTGLLLALGSLLGGPLLLLLFPASLIELWALWRLLFSRQDRVFYNVLDKKGVRAALSSAAGGPGSPPRLKANGSSGTSTLSESGDVATYTNSFMPLACLPAPWESHSLLLNIVGEGDKIVGNSSMTTATTLMGVGDSEGYAMRCNGEEPKRCKFVRIGRVPNGEASPFVSEVSDPFLETISGSTDINADRRKAAIKPGEVGDDTIRCGDIVMIVDQQSRKTLSVNGWWIVFTSDSVSTNCYFVITILNEEGVLKHGSPLKAGSPFRLRSAKYPKYEVGCQTSSTIENKGNLLVMYEFSKYLARSPVRWKQGGYVNPLFLCTMATCAKPSLHPSVVVHRRSKWNLYGGLVSTLSYLRRHPLRKIRVVGHAEVLHRLLNKVFMVAVIVVSGSDEYGEKEWKCLRSPKDADKLLDAAEAQQEVILKSNGKSMTSIAGVELHRPLDHESLMGQDLRLMNYRFQAAIKRDYHTRGCAQALFLSVLQNSSIWDSWMLDSSWTQREGAAPLGVTPQNDKTLGPAVLTTCVARMLWESHVREELCILYAAHIVCYAPLTSKPSWSLSLRDIVGIGDVLFEDSPLPGMFALRIETMGRVHYLSCSTYGDREVLRDTLAANIGSLPTLSVRASIASSILGGASPDSFTHLSGQWLPSTRLILNARTFVFDSQSRSSKSRWLKGESHWKLSEHLLQAASDMEALHYSSGKKAVPGGPLQATGADLTDDVEEEERELKSQLLSFLDEVSLLRAVNLGSIDRNSKEALCFFCNVYHTLLLHARTVLRLPSKADWNLFFSSVSYAIGDDVFSLAELEQCVLRGKLCRPKVTSRHEAPVISLSDSHFHYALEKADCRINFLLNSGSVSNPEALYLLTPRNLETQLNSASMGTLVHSMSVDFGYHTVTLPKLCEVFRADLGGDDAGAILRNCLKYIDKTNCGADLETILTTNASRVPTVRYLLQTFESRSRLVLVK